MPKDDASVERAAHAIAHADALLIAAGAGMGVDSGLPDFRGPEGFWRAYPPYAGLGLAFENVANPRHFRTDPALGWGFYGHRTNLYRRTTPHEGFAILRVWSGRLPHGSFVFTSNVDGHFQRAGFDPDRVVEVHGSIETRQCLDDCGVGLFPADRGEVDVDPDTFRAAEPFPSCPGCGELARPNILMFDDGGWDPRRTVEQHRRLADWLETIQLAKLVVVEIGAGRAIPTVRRFTEQLVEEFDATLIRINPRDPDVPAGQVALGRGALETLRKIDRRLG